MRWLNAWSKDVFADNVAKNPSRANCPTRIFCCVASGLRYAQPRFKITKDCQFVCSRLLYVKHQSFEVFALWEQDKVCSRLFYVKHQSFEVLAFWVVYAHWVVGRLGELVQDAHVALCHGCGGEHCGAEILLADNLRA